MKKAKFYANTSSLCLCWEPDGTELSSYCSNRQSLSPRRHSENISHRGEKRLAQFLFISAKSDFCSLDSKKLETRTFCTAEFYKDNEDVITPAGLSFFQSDWDMSVTDCFHKHLGIPSHHYMLSYFICYLCCRNGRADL